MNWQEMVLAFHHKFGVPSPMDQPPALRDVELRVRLILEEVRETFEAVTRGDLSEAVDGLVDIIYVCLGTACAWGVDLGPIFDEVHRTNMAKEVGATRKDGKILKPPGWKPPRIAELLAEQANKWRK